MAQRVRSSDSGENVTDKTRQDALAQCAASALVVADISDQLRQARSVHSNNIKAWKKLGVNTDALRKAIADRLRDPDEVLSELHEYTRFRALQNMPSIQQDLMALLSNVLDIDDDEQHNIQRQRWHDDGAFSGRNKTPRDGNPHLAGSEAYACWDDGWLHDQDRIAHAMGRGEAPVDTSRARPAVGRKKAAAAAPRKAANGAAPRKRRRVAEGHSPANA